MDIPVIDFAKCLAGKENQIPESTLAEAGEKLYETFSKAGFAFITNTGITRSEVLEIDALSQTFFSLDTETKMKYFKREALEGLCYDPIGSRKSHDPKIKKPDYVEGLRIKYFTGCSENVPDIEDFWEKIRNFEEKCKSVGLLVFKSLGVGMKLKDKDIFKTSHMLANEKGNPTALKLLHYPPITDDVIVEKGQLRFPEHTDFGTLTFLFSDDLTGLQVKNKDGEYQHIPQVPNSILINVGDELQYWTGGRLRSTSHRVVMPTTLEQKIKPRRSIAYFLMVDDNVMLDQLEFEDGKKAMIKDWKPMTSIEFIKKRFNETYY